MKAVIMAGGFGTRLRPLTYNIPKPMAPVMNKPMMEHIVLLLKKYGITDIIALLYFQPDTITGYFGDGSRWGVNMQYKHAEADYGTAGSVRNAREFLDERFLIISGDVLTDFNLNDIVEFHDKNKAEATITLTHHPNPLQFGVVMTDEKHAVTRFLEKPSWGQVFSDTINTGIYVLEPETLDRIPYQEEFDFSKDLFPTMLRAGAPLLGYIAEGYWKDIGNLNEYLISNFDCLDSKVQLHFADYEKAEGMWISTKAEIDPDAQLRAPLIVGHGARISAGAVVENSVIGENCKISHGARLRDAVLWDGVQVGEECRIHKAVLGYRTTLDSQVFISENDFISDDVTIGKEATIKTSIKIWPNKQVEAGATVTSSMVMGDRWLRELFTASKVTGLVNSEITPEFATKLGAALGALLGMGKTVLVGRDSSPAGRMINRSMITGLVSTGIHVFDLRNIPMPILRHQLRNSAASAGVVSRLSPRQPEHLEIIFLDQNGIDLPVGRCKSIERLFFGEDFFRAPIDKIGQIDFPIRVTEQYQANFLKDLKVEDIHKHHFKVVIDFSYGGASQIFPYILGVLGVELVAFNAYLEGHRYDFEERNIRKSLQEIQKIVPIVNADLGITLNASAEKIWVIDSDGKAIDPQMLALAVTRMVLENNRYKKIAVPVDISAHIEDIGKEFGCEIIYTTSDHWGLTNAVVNQGAQFAAGTRGGFIFGDFSVASDGMYAISKILEIIAVNGKLFSECIEKIGPIRMKQSVIPCPWEKKGQVMRNIMSHTTGKKRFLIDGVRITEDDHHVLFIPDKENALFYIQAEAPTMQRVDEALDHYGALMEEWKK